MTGRRRAAAAVMVFVAAACSAPPLRVDTVDAAARLPVSVRVQVLRGTGAVVRNVALEEYVHATILSEFAPASGDPAAVERMYEVQAVISRTYAAANTGRHKREGFDLCATTHCQLFDPARVTTSRWSTAASSATRRTAGTILWHRRLPASALFHADCGGRTSAAVNVWGGRALPYLIGLRDDGPAALAHSEWEFEAPREALRDALNADTRTRVGASLQRIELRQRDPAGRVSRVVLHGDVPRTVRGEDFRAVFSRAFGARSLRSTNFDVRTRGDVLHFTGRGYGHGVGLCQAGALARIEHGASLGSVLARYYPGTTMGR